MLLPRGHNVVLDWPTFLTVCNFLEVKMSKAANASFCIALAIESNAKAEITFV